MLGRGSTMASRGGLFRSSLFLSALGHLKESFSSGLAPVDDGRLLPLEARATDGQLQESDSGFVRHAGHFTQLTASTGRMLAMTNQRVTRSMYPANVVYARW